MENKILFPLNSGFLFPNGEFFSTEGRGHERLAYRLLVDKFKVTDPQKLSDAEFVLQDDFSAILIRYRWNEKLLYLPKTAPTTFEGKMLFKKAIKFYAEEGYKILNLYKITLSSDDYYIVKEFFVEDFEFVKKDLILKCENYTNIIIKDKNGNYLYNPERIGD